MEDGGRSLARSGSVMSSQLVLTNVCKHSAPINLSVHPAILYRATRRKIGVLGARLQTFVTTKELIDRLASYGRVRQSKTGRPVTLAVLASFVFLRRRPKNFVVDVFPR